MPETEEVTEGVRHWREYRHMEYTDLGEAVTGLIATIEEQEDGCGYIFTRKKVFLLSDFMRSNKLTYKKSRMNYNDLMRESPGIILSTRWD